MGVYITFKSFKGILLFIWMCILQMYVSQPLFTLSSRLYFSQHVIFLMALWVALWNSCEVGLWEMCKLYIRGAEGIIGCWPLWRTDYLCYSQVSSQVGIIVMVLTTRPPPSLPHKDPYQSQRSSSWLEFTGDFPIFSLAMTKNKTFLNPHKM